MALASKAEFLLMPTNGRPLLVLSLNARVSDEWARDNGLTRRQWQHVGGELSLRGLSGPLMYLVHESFAGRHDRARIMEGLDIVGMVAPCVPVTRLTLAKMRLAALVWGPRPDGSIVTWTEVLAAIEQYGAEQKAACDAAENVVGGDPGPEHDPSTNCYCGGPESAVYPHRYGTGYYCRRRVAQAELDKRE